MTDYEAPVPRPATREEIARAEARAPSRFRLPRLPGVSELASITPKALVKALPDVVKVTGAMLWRTNQWTVNASLHIGGVVLRGAVSGQSPQDLVEQVGTEARQSLRELLGLPEIAGPMPRALRDRVGTNGSDPGPDIGLPGRMAALLDASADLDHPDTGHPAYVRLLTELSPDEARILRVFAQRGPQPSVDVRTRRPFGVGSELVAPGLTMLGRYAGVRHMDRVPAYLNNLFRLGLIWFSREELPDQRLYDVLEAQEEVEEAMRRAGRGVTVRRSLELTAFGRNLCAVTGLLPPGESAARATGDEATDEDTARNLLPPETD